MLGTYSIDENGDTTLTDYGVYAVEDGAMVFNQTIKAAARSSGRSELDDGLDVRAARLEQSRGVGERHAPRDEALEPAVIGARERLARQLVVPVRGVHGTEHGVVLEHHRRVQHARVDLDRGARRGRRP